MVGRFLQEDTYRGDGLNLYAYCANNPVMYFDPSGHNAIYPDDKPKTVDTPGGQIGNQNGGMPQIGRGGKQKRLREIAADDKVSSTLRGEIKRDINEIKRGKRKNIRVPVGYQMAHRRGYEARKGFGYKYSDLNTIENHKRQHKIDGYGKGKMK